MECLEEKKELAVWICHSLFERNKTNGTTANISFLHDGHIWISRSGSCFGLMKVSDFVETDFEGALISQSGEKASKELPLHMALYQKSDAIQAILHMHSPSAVRWSCLKYNEGRDVIPHYTPYLDMKLGKVVGVPYAPPGSEKLFALMRNYVGTERGYLLSNHGPIVGGYSLMNAFEAMEELEQAAWIAWNMQSFQKHAMVYKERDE